MHIFINSKIDCFRLKEWASRRLKIKSIFTIIGIAASFVGSPSVRANDNDFHKTAQGISVNIGLIEVAKIRGNSITINETKIHGNPPSGRHEYHLMVAVFAAATGRRTSDATAKTRISELGLVGLEIVMKPMKLEDIVTYGGFVSFPSAADYVIRITVARPRINSVYFSVPYSHQPP